LHRLIIGCGVCNGCRVDRLRYSFYGLQTAAAYKDREQTEETLLLGGEQVVAPLQRIVQRLLACWQVLLPASQHLKPILEALEQGLGRKQLNVSCCQFDGQGQAFETSADGRDGVGIGSGQLKSD